MQVRHCCECRQTFCIPEDSECGHETAVGPLGDHADSIRGPFRGLEEWKSIPACLLAEGKTVADFEPPNSAIVAALKLDELLNTSVFTRVVARLFS